MHTPLHVHTAHGSIGDSILRIEEYIEKAKELNMKALAITDHGSMAAMYKFYSACTKADIKPIIGCEVYLVDDKTVKERGYSHLVLIAKNNIGLENLLYITSDANLNGMYYKPRTDLETIKEYSEGLICLSGCVGGLIPKKILALSESEDMEKDYNQILDTVKEFKDIFKDDYYLEIQPGEFEEQETVNEGLVQIAKELDIELVATNDIHYLNQEDYVAHNAHVAITQKREVAEGVFIYPDTCYYLMDTRTLINSFGGLDVSDIERAIKNTNIIADKCNIELSVDELYMPVFDTPNGLNESDFLAKASLEALEKISHRLEDPPKYLDRCLYELDVLNKLNFPGYILTVKDFIDYAHNNDIAIGPGRGSICGSLVAYLLGITNVDPVKYNLLFERFLSVYRTGAPDIDIDISSDKRDQMFEYALEKYGHDKCALVSTFGIRKAKSALRDVGRVFSIPLETTGKAAKLIPISHYDEEGNKATDLSIADSLAVVPELREIMNESEEHREWFDMAMKLEDLPSVSSIHAAGTLISPKPLIEYVPLRQKKGGKNSVDISATSLCLSDAEMAGVIKQDFLGLSTLSIIDQTQKMVDFKFDFDDEKLYNDSDVWDLIGSRNTTTLFQIGSRLYKDRMHRLKPSNITELAACLALVRGPCISSKLDQDYMQIIEGTKVIEEIHPFYDDVTEYTNGILLYQEDLMKILINFGFSSERSFQIMKSISKKKIKEIEAAEDEYRGFTKEHNVDKTAADKIWNIILDMGLYSFNSSHAVAYAMLCYQSAYLKVNYPLEYMASALTNAYVRKEEVKETVEECRRLGIKFSGLDANKSEWSFTINREEENTLNIGLCAIKGFGDKATEALLEHRPYDSFEDIVERVPKSLLSKRAMVPAIFAGLFDSFNGNRVEIYEEYHAIRKEEPNTVIKIGIDSIELVTSTDYDLEAFVLTEPLLKSPVNSFIPIGFEKLRTKSRFTIDALVTRVKKMRDKNNNMMAFVTLSTADGALDAVVFASTYKSSLPFLKNGAIGRVTARKENDNQCVVQKIE